MVRSLLCGWCCCAPFSAVLFWVVLHFHPSLVWFFSCVVLPFPPCCWMLSLSLLPPPLVSWCSSLLLCVSQLLWSVACFLPLPCGCCCSLHHLLVGAACFLPIPCVQGGGKGYCFALLLLLNGLNFPACPSLLEVVLLTSASSLWERPFSFLSEMK